MMGDRSAMMRLRLDDSITRQKVKSGTVRRILPYAGKYRWALVLLLVVTALDAGITVANPLLLGTIIDRGIVPHRLKVVVIVSLAIAGLGLADALRDVPPGLGFGPDRPGDCSRSAHPGIQARPAAAAGVLYPLADWLAGQQAEHRRRRGAAGRDLAAVPDAVDCPDASARAGRDVRPVLADHLAGAGRDPAVRRPRQADRPEGCSGSPERGCSSTPSLAR